MSRLKPVMVSSKALEIMHKSGAYLPVEDYARARLLACPPIIDLPGLDRVRAVLQSVLPNVASDKISVREYDNVYPSVVWDSEHELFAFARPKPCEDHPAEQCLCWIGPALQDAAKVHKGPRISPAKLWRTYAVEMGGDTTVKRVSSVAPKDMGPCFEPNFGIF